MVEVVKEYLVMVVEVLVVAIEVGAVVVMWCCGGGG